jgi:hypothetical protein
MLNGVVDRAGRNRASVARPLLSIVDYATLEIYYTAFFVLLTLNQMSKLHFYVAMLIETTAQSAGLL